MVIASGLLGALTLGVPGSASGDPQATVSLKASRRVDACRHDPCFHTPPVVLSGQVHGVTNPAGLVVDIVAYSPDYGESMTITATADRQGKFQTSFRPSVDVSLSAALAPGQAAQRPPSPPQRVIALPKISLGVTRVYQFPGHRPQRNFSLMASAPLYAMNTTVMQAGSANRAYFYAGRTRHGVYRRIGSARFTPMGWGMYSIRFTTSPAFPYTRVIQQARYFFGCTRGTIMKGMGVPFPRCGNVTLRQ